MNRAERERLREAFLPEIVRILFIGESPPASGRFFYLQDSGLYRAMRDAFQKADSSFLNVFKKSGCYLFDLCPEPVDRLPAAARRQACQRAQPRLADAITRFQPARIATLLRSIEASVNASIPTAAWQGSPVNLPYPGRWSHHRAAFIRELAPHIHTPHS